MTEVSGSLTFEFGADFSGFARAADSAGAKLDSLSQAAARWATGTSSAMTRAFQGGTNRPLDNAGSLPHLNSDDDDADKELTRLQQKLALLQSTGAAHAAIAEQIKIEAAQEKLGSDATAAQKDQAAALVRQIDAATAAQTRMKQAQDNVNTAWSFGATAFESGIEGLILRGEKLKDVLAQIVLAFARQGLLAALTGGGVFGGLLGTQGTGGATGGLFGAISSGFSGFFATGGTLGSGDWGVVGEKGPEVVAGPAAVVPLGQIAGRGMASQLPTQVIHFNVTSPDAPSFARSEAQMAAIVSRAVARGQRNA